MKDQPKEPPRLKRPPGPTRPTGPMRPTQPAGPYQAPGQVPRGKRPFGPPQELPPSFAPHATQQAKKPVKKQKPKEITTDPKKLFLEPITPGPAAPASTGFGPPQPTPKVETLPKRKRQAYHSYMSKLTNKLATLQKQIDASPTLSPAFKEEFIAYKKYVDIITVAEGTIGSKKTYQRVFFQPKFNKLRQVIFNVLPQLEQLSKQIKQLNKALKKEKVTPTEEAERLRKLAKEKPKKILEKTKPIAHDWKPRTVKKKKEAPIQKGTNK